MPQEPLVIDDQVQDARRLLRLTGPILINNLFDFQGRVRSDHSKDLILDFSGVPYIDSAGIGALVGAYVTRQKDGRRLCLVGVNDRVRAALKVTHVEQFFSFYNSVAEVEAAVA